MRFSVNSLMRSDVAYSLETGMAAQPLKLRMKIVGQEDKKQKNKIRRKRLYPVFPYHYYNIPPMEPAKGFRASDVKPVGHGDPWQAAPPLNYYLKQMEAPSTSPPYFHVLHKRNFTGNNTGCLLEDRNCLAGTGNVSNIQEAAEVKERQNTLWDEEPAESQPIVEKWGCEAMVVRNVTRKKRQTSSSGTQIRGGQDCIDRSTPPGVNVITYHESAHCLRFSELWYNVYALKEAFLSHSVEFNLFEKHCLEGVGEQWVFKTSGFKAEVGTFCRRTANPSTTMVFSYTPLDISNRDFICLTPGHYLLLIPRPIAQDRIAEYPQPSERSGRWLLLAPEVVVFDGDECDKVGVSYSAFAKQPDRCNRPQGSCLRNQPLQMWRHDCEKESKGERGKYFLQNFARVPENALAKFMNKEYLNLFYEGQYRSVVEIEYKADSNGIIKKESTAQVTEVYVDSTCEHHTKITVLVTNNGLVSSMFRPRMTNCPVNIPAVWTQQEGPLVVIAPQRKHLFRLSLYGSLPSTRFHCSIEILNPKHKIVAVRRVTIQKFDRCLCMWHCLCACSGSIEALKCDPMTIEHYHAAGFYGSMAVDTSSFSMEENFQILYAIAKSLPIIFIMHLLLFVLGKRWYSDGLPNKTALYDFHITHGGRMVDFAGYFLPIQYSEGIPESHKHTRSHASLFDVSHMLQTVVRGKDRIRFIESIATADVKGLKNGTGCLSLFTDNETGGILDDLIITKCEDHLFIVTNASRKGSDMQLMLEAQERILKSGGDVTVEFRNDLSLVALQGPNAASALSNLTKEDLSGLYFMNSAEIDLCGVLARVSRTGYTGEDGFEISVSSDKIKTIADALIELPDVRLAGLGARDSLRLEAGLCLYGNDIDLTTTPASAGLMWTIGKRRKEARDFPGAKIILNDKPKLKRVGLVSRKGPPVRGGCPLKDKAGNEVGKVTSGCPSPTLGINIAMAYIPASMKVGETINALVRGKDIEMEVVKMPFVKPSYYVKPKNI